MLRYACREPTCSHVANSRQKQQEHENRTHPTLDYEFKLELEREALLSDDDENPTDDVFGPPSDPSEEEEGN